MSIGAEATPVAPGTGGDTGTEGTSSAGTQNTDTGTGGTPDTIPYSRFKEVNDQLVELKDFGQFKELGYDADSLRGLAEFEAAYLKNPVMVLTQLVDNLTDLPDEAKAAIKEQFGVTAAAPPTASGGTSSDESGGDEPPAWAKPLVEDYQARQQQSEADQRAAKLDEVVRLWDDADKKDGLTDEQLTPEKTKYAYIMANAGAHGTTDQIAEAARRDFMESREHILKGNRSEVRETFTAGSPRPAPGGTGVLPSGATLPKTLQDATEQVKLAIQQGTIPSIGGERS